MHLAAKRRKPFKKTNFCTNRAVNHGHFVPPRPKPSRQIEQMLTRTATGRFNHKNNGR
jgi:hypothetical protein